MKKLPGTIEILMAPEGEAGGGSASSGGGGASSTPSGAPSGEGSTPSAASSSPSGAATPAESSPAPASPQPLTNEFDGFGAEEGEDLFEPEPSTQVAPKEQKPAEQKAQPSEQQPQTPAQTAPQQQAPQDQQAGQQGQVPQFPSYAEPAKIADGLMQNVDVLVEQLAGTPEFALSEADIEAINADVVGHIPKLLAKAHIRAQASAMRQMEQIVPAIMQRYMRVEKARNESQNAFYQRWPGLNPKDHGSLVDRFATVYRRANPGATREQMIEDLGPMIMVSAKIDPSKVAANGSAGAPVSVPQRKTPPTSPFVPAVGGSAAPPAPEMADPWSGYAMGQDEE